MDYEKKNKDAISTIKQALRQLATNGVPVGNMIKAIKDIEEKYAKSEDEKIRKEMIEILEKEARDFPSSVIAEKSNSWIAWLEKQSKNNMGISEATKQELEDNLNKALEKETPESWNKFLDEQNLVNKVEPKFHEGQWITNGDYTWKIVEVKPLDYILQSQDGNTVDDTISHVDEQFHSFTIEDAKDGDVLVSESECGLNTWYCIFKSLDDDENMTVHCYLARDGRLQTMEELCSNKDPRNVKPATKGQRDTLEKAMADAGYEWDAEKKELRKIEQKPTEWHREDEQNLNACLGYIPDEYLRRWLTDVVHVKYDKPANKVESRQEELTEFEKAIKQVMEEAIECGDTHNLKADAEMLLRLVQKSTWSEEDIELLDNTIKFIEDRVAATSPSLRTYIPTLTGKEIPFLKALKDRVQPKQEWNEEDERTYKSVLYAFEHNYSLNSEQQKFVKSLKERYVWKPSDEQMKNLSRAFNGGTYRASLLMELYLDLKKLREE